MKCILFSQLNSDIYICLLIYNFSLYGLLFPENCQNNFILMFFKMLNLLIESKWYLFKAVFGILINLERVLVVVNLLDSLFSSLSPQPMPSKFIYSPSMYLPLKEPPKLAIRTVFTEWIYIHVCLWNPFCCGYS